MNTDRDRLQDVLHGLGLVLHGEVEDGDVNEAPRWALLSRCGTYRYALGRRVGLTGGTCVFVMLNPSTADGLEDDPTLRRCIGFARRWGYGRLWVMNLFAYRATDPRELDAAEDPVGSLNDYLLRGTVEQMNVERDMLVCAWGNDGNLLGRDGEILSLLRHAAPCDLVTGDVLPIHHFGLTKAGQPRHPLYLRKTTEPETWHREVRSPPGIHRT